MDNRDAEPGGEKKGRRLRRKEEMRRGSRNPGKYDALVATACVVV